MPNRGRAHRCPTAPEGPGGYELRWWDDDKDDVVADVLQFGDPAAAMDYFRLAASARCRPAGAAVAASSPPGGRDIAWRNPDGALQQDLFILRGARVYRVSVVLAGSEAGLAARDGGFALADALACELPQAGCAAGQDQQIAEIELAEQLTWMRYWYPGGRPKAASARASADGAVARECPVEAEGRSGRSGSALSQWIEYDHSATVHLGVSVYRDERSARAALLSPPRPDRLRCLLGSLTAAVRRHGYRPGATFYRSVRVPVAEGGVAIELGIPLRR